MIIKADKSIIPALDVETLGRVEQVVKATCGITGVGGYKIGFELALKYGLRQVVDAIRRLTDLPIIYDHQKAGTDVPFTGERFVKVCNEAGVDAIILFPQAGPATLKAWIESAKKAGLSVIVGGEMTHHSYLAADGGYLIDDAPDMIYSLAAELRVTDFVVPGNRPERIRHYKRLLERAGIKPVFYSPGLVSQGGRVSEGAKAAGSRWHAIVGRAIYGKDNAASVDDMRAAAEALVKGLEHY